MKLAAKGKRHPRHLQPPRHLQVSTRAAGTSGTSWAGCTGTCPHAATPALCPGRGCSCDLRRGDHPSCHTDKPSKCTQAIEENLFWTGKKSALEMLPLSPQAEQQDQSQSLHSSDLASSGSAGTIHWISYKARRPPRSPSAPALNSSQVQTPDRKQIFSIAAQQEGELLLPSHSL